MQLHDSPVTTHVFMASNIMTLLHNKFLHLQIISLNLKLSITVVIGPYMPIWPWKIKVGPYMDL